MPKTIIVSNRLPLQLTIENNQVNSVPSVGGLATGLKSVHRDSNGLWIGWTGLTEEEIDPQHEKDIENEVKKTTMRVSPTN